MFKIDEKIREIFKYNRFQAHQGPQQEFLQCHPGIPNYLVKNLQVRLFDPQVATFNYFNQL